MTIFNNMITILTITTFVFSASMLRTFGAMFGANKYCISRMLLQCTMYNYCFYYWHFCVIAVLFIRAAAIIRPSILTNCQFSSQTCVAEFCVCENRFKAIGPQ